MRRNRHFWAVIPILFAYVVGAACDPGQESSAIGVSLSTSDRPEVRFVTCGQHRITEITLFELTNAVVVGDEDDKVLWRIRSSGAPARDQYEVGVAPEGFRVVTPFISLELEQDREYGFVLDTTSIGGYIVFEPRQLRVGSVLTLNGGYLDPADFVDRARRRCK